MDSKVFWSVLLALLVFSGVMFALFALGVVGARAAADEAQKQAVQELVRVSHDPDPLGMRAELARRQQADMGRRRLGAGQRCVGGVVVVVDGSNYSQLGTVGNPVRCSGGYADRAIR